MNRKPDFSKKNTPPMGWSSWNALGGEITEENIKAQIDVLVSSGLADVGYEYVNIDDCWMNGRDAITGRVKYNPARFPHGLKAIADYAHENGIKAGIYTDGGDNTCASASGKRAYGRSVGLYRHEEDLWMYLSDGYYRDLYARTHAEDPGVECWGFDFIKIDWCGGRDHNLDPEITYTLYDNVIHRIEEHTGKDKIHNLCCWGYYGPWMLRVGDYWRAGGDIDMTGTRFSSVLECIDEMKINGRFSLPGHYADADMLVVGKHLTTTEDKSHFAMWCMFSGPLVLGFDLRTLRPETLEIITNKELIDLNNDPLAKCASYVKTLGTSTELWFKKTVDPDSGDGAIALLNRGEEAETITLDFADLCVSKEACMRDLHLHKDLGTDTQYTATIPSHDIVVLRICTQQGFLRKDFGMPSEDEVEIPRSNPEMICAYTAKNYVEEYGALLIDVRSAEEYAKDRLPGAINIEYTSLMSASDILPKDPDIHLIVYCSTRKQSAQAFWELKRMKYNTVHILSDMEVYRALCQED